MSAGCAIGPGNVWKFPYICGMYGGAAFIVMYVIFLALLGLPILICEFSVGRASRKGIGKAFDVLEKKSGIGEAVFAAMTHAFFTLSIGMGAILIGWMCLAVLFVTAIYLIALLTGRKKSV